MFYTYGAHIYQVRITVCNDLPIFSFDVQTLLLQPCDWGIRTQSTCEENGLSWVEVQYKNAVRFSEASETIITAAEADCNVFGSEREALFPQENR